MPVSPARDGSDVGGRLGAPAVTLRRAGGALGRWLRRHGLHRPAAAAAGVTAVALIGLSGCGTSRPDPTPLTPVAPQLSARAAWQSNLGSAIDFPLQVSAIAGRIVVADGAGGVRALQASTGQLVWSGNAGERLTAGVGSDGRFAAVVTRSNQLVVMDQGQVLWRKPLPSHTTTAPLVAGERVFVVGVDRVVHGFDALDGRRLWSVQRPGEALTLAQPGLLLPYGNTLVAGIGAAMVGIEPVRGTVRWEVPLTAPRGTNEVERLNDLVGPPVRVGDLICARAFQTAIGCVDASRSVLRWNRSVGGFTPLAGDEALLYGADGADRITAWRTGNGELAWTNERLLYRRLSAPAAWGRSVVFGDFEGQVHFLSREDGQLVLRMATDGSAVAAPPVVVDGSLVVVTRRGGLFAYRAD